MDVLVVCLLFMSKQTIASVMNGTRLKEYSYPFVAGIVEKSSSQLVAIGVVVSRHWVLTVAHVFPADSNGLPYENYSVLAGQPFTVFDPIFAMTHPAYTSGLYTAEDFALFRVADAIETRPVFISSGRFPWNAVHCQFMWSDVEYLYVREGFLNSLKSEVTAVQNCLVKKQRKPVGLLRFYVNDVLCGRAGRNHPNACLGKTGGILFCENLLVGLLIRREWCQETTANFTDVGSYTNWLRSRVSDGHFIRLGIALASAPVSSGQLALVVIACLLSARFCR